MDKVSAQNTPCFNMGLRTWKTPSLADSVALNCKLDLRWQRKDVLRLTECWKLKPRGANTYFFKTHREVSFSWKGVYRGQFSLLKVYVLYQLLSSSSSTWSLYGEDTDLSWEFITHIHTHTNTHTHSKTGPPSSQRLPVDRNETRPYHLTLIFSAPHTNDFYLQPG